jgi:hypothetical protein
MASLRGLLPVLLVLGVVFGPDAYKVLSSICTSPLEVSKWLQGCCGSGAQISHVLLLLLVLPLCTPPCTTDPPAPPCLHYLVVTSQA